MEQAEFLEKHVFTGLKKVVGEPENGGLVYFSEEDFEKVLSKAEHFGIGIYSITTKMDNEVGNIVKHEEHKKKATDSKWYSKAFLTLRTKQKGLNYAGEYKVSSKLLARENIGE